MSDTIVSLEAEVHSLKKEVQDLTDSLKNAQDNLVVKGEDHKSEMAKAQKLLEEKLIVETELDRTKKVLKGVEADYEDFKVKAKEKFDEVAKRCKESEGALKETADLVTSLSKVVGEMYSEWNQTIDNINKGSVEESANQSLDKAFKDMNTTQNPLQKRLETAGKIEKSLKQILKATEDLQKTVTPLQIAEVNNNIVNTVNKLIAITTEKVTKEDQQASLGASATKAASATPRESNEAKLKELKKEIKEAQDSSAKATTDIASIEASIVEQTKIFGDLKLQTNSLQTKATTLQSEKKRIETKIEEFRREIKARDDEIASLTSSVATLKKDLERIRKENQEDKITPPPAPKEDPKKDHHKESKLSSVRENRDARDRDGKTSSRGGKNDGKQSGYSKKGDRDEFVPKGSTGPYEYVPKGGSSTSPSKTTEVKKPETVHPIVTLKALQAEKAKLEAEVAAENKIRQEKDAQAVLLDKDVRALRAELDHLKKPLNAKILQIDKNYLEAEIEGIKKKRTAQDEEATALDNAVKNLKEELERLKSTPLQATDRQSKLNLKKELEEKLMLARAEKEKELAEQQTLKEEIKDTEDRVIFLDGVLRELRRDTDHLRKSLGKLAAQVEHREANKKLLSKEQTALKKIGKEAGIISEKVDVKASTKTVEPEERVEPPVVEKSTKDKKGKVPQTKEAAKEKEVAKEKDVPKEKAKAGKNKKGKKEEKVEPEEEPEVKAQSRTEEERSERETSPSPAPQEKEVKEAKNEVKIQKDQDREAELEEEPFSRNQKGKAKPSVPIRATNQHKAPEVHAKHVDHSPSHRAEKAELLWSEMAASEKFLYTLGPILAGFFLFLVAQK
jgi:chromosome segregation ATPase